MAITLHMVQAEHEALVDSYRTACEIRRDRCWHRQRQAEIEAVFKEINKEPNKVYDKSEDKDDIASSAMPAPRRHNHQVKRSPRAPLAARKSRAWEFAATRAPGRPPPFRSRLSQTWRAPNRRSINRL